MDVYQIDDMRDGWFIGDFEPSVLQTKDFEVGLRRFAKGDVVEPHFHVLAPEINVIVRGALSANGRRIESGQILVVRPREVCEVEFLEDTEIVVVKSPSIPGDKYRAELQAARNHD